MEHVLIRKLEHVTGTNGAPKLGFAVETRDRPGPAYKGGAYEGDIVWIQLHGGLFVAKARVRIGWVGEYSNINEVRARTKGSPLASVEDFWARRAKFGYAAVAQLVAETWIDPFWAGPRTYGYEWVLLDDAKKRASWLDPKDPPRTGEDVGKKFASWKRSPP